MTRMRTLLGPTASGTEKVVDRGGEDELEAAAPDPDGHPVTCRVEAGPEVERLPRPVHLLHEEDDAASANLAPPRRDGSDQCLRRAFSACPRVDPHRDELHLARVVAAEAADDADPAVVVLDDEEGLVVTLRRLRRPVTPGRLGLADGVLVARREELRLLPEQAEARVPPAAPLVGSDPSRVDAPRLTRGGRCRLAALARHALAAADLEAAARALERPVAPLHLRPASPARLGERLVRRHARRCGHRARVRPATDGVGAPPKRRPRPHMPGPRAGARRGPDLVQRLRSTGNDTSRRVEMPPRTLPPGSRPRTNITSSC